jgi:hypothetical protein
VNQPDEITQALDVIARLLETNGYALEVDYQGATIIVWTDNWPILIKPSRQPILDTSEEM